MEHSFAPHISGFNPLVGTASWSDKTLLDCGKFYPPTARTPEARLRFYASQFNLGLVGLAGEISPAEQHLEAMLRRPEANAVLLSVIDDPRSSPVAKLYALCGLKRMGSGGYEAALVKLRGFEGQVSVMLGDQMFQEDIREAADRIENLECSEGG